MPVTGRRRFIGMALGGAAGGIASPFVLRSALGATPSVHLKMTMADVSTHPLYPLLQQFAADVLNRTNGDVSIKVYGAGQLGSQVNAMTGMQTGIIDLVCHTTGFIETVYPTVAVLDLPYIFKNVGQAEKVLDGPVGRQLFDLFPAKGIYGLCWGTWGWRPVTHSERAVPEPKDIAGTKIRIQPGAIYAATYKTLGAQPIVIDVSEVYLALSQHAVDAVEVPLISLIASKLYEVAKHVTLTNFVYNAGAVMASKRTMDRLSKPNQTAIREAALALTPVWRTMIAQKTDAAIAFLKTKGCTVSPVDEPAYAKALQPVYTEFRPVVGPKLVDEIMKETGAA
jgi:tripartite ATP-independent transporter DctP family solute receptor